MATAAELVQVNISLPKTHVSILPELMKVVSTAYSSSYSWDSMKVSVSSDVPSDKGSRMIINLGKRVNEESETIQGMIHRCFESVCKHGDPSDNLVGEVKMISYAQKTLKDHLKELAKSDDETIEGTGWLEKNISSEMFYPSWYDNLRLKSVPQLGEDSFPPEKEVCSTSPVFIVNNVNVHHFYESENELFLPKQPVKTFSKNPKESSDETFRLKKICDRAKTFVQPPECKREDSPLDIKMKIRELKERLDPPDSYDDDFVYGKTEGANETQQRDFSYGQYLSYEEELPSFPLREKEEHYPNDHKIALIQKESYMKSHELQESFLRQHSQENIHVLPKPKSKKKGDESRLENSRINKTQMIHRSFSANALSRLQGEDTSRERNQSRKKNEERRRPKSGPEKGVEFMSTCEDEFSKGDSPIISEGRFTTKQTRSHRKLKKDEMDPNQEHPKEKKKKRKSHHPREKATDEKGTADKELTGKDHEKRVREKGHKTDEIGGTKLIISYKPYEDDTKSEIDETKSDLNETKTRHRHIDKEEVETKHHRKTKKMVDEKYEDQRAVGKHEEKPDGKKSRGKDEEKKYRRTKEERNEQHKMKNVEVFDAMDISRNVIADNKTDKETKRNVESNKLWKRSLMKKMTSPTIKEETQATTEEQVSIELDEKTSKRALSFLEIISVMADEIKQLGRKKDRKKLKNKLG